MNHLPSRRDMLKAGGALVVSFALAGKIGSAFAQAPAAAGKPLALTEVDAFLAIDEKGTVTLFTGKVDLGTGVRTALAQMVADELDVPFESVSVVQGDTGLTPDQGNTWASLTIQASGMQIRNAAAVARNALLDDAAKSLNVSRDSLTVADGTISGGGKSVNYAELIGGKQFSLTVDHKKPLPHKDPTSYKIVGKPIPRVDIPGKVFGTFTYMQDFRVPGMLHARVVFPPALGAKLESVDEGSIKDIPGLFRVVREGDFLAVVAESEWAAIKAAQQIKAVWSKSETLPDQAKLWEHVRATTVAKDDETSKVGDAAAALAAPGARKVEGTYDFAINLHGSIGPSCAVAEFRDGQLTCWTASQATHNLRKQLAEMLSVPVESVRCVYLDGAGCYGRNGHEDAAGDAAFLARAVGRPVRVQWSRADEHGWEPNGPPTLADIRGALDANGDVVAWESEFFIPQGAGGNCPLTTQTLARIPAKQFIAPGNIIRNSDIPYKLPNVRTVCHRLETTPFRPSWIRTPGRMQNTYVNECFMDELATAAGADPIEFRIKYLDPADRRGIEVLTRLAALAKWDKRPSPQKADGDVLRGRGVSYVKYELNRTYVGVVAEVEVNRTTGRIRAPRFYVVHDCGQIINPDGLANQLEGQVVQTLSRTLFEEVKFDRAHITSRDWASYPILKFPDVPEVVLDMIDRPTERPWGAGEPATAVIPSAISNAVFDATGVRLRSVPYTPEKVLAALRQGI